MVNTAHFALHKIIKIMLTSMDLKFENVQPLIKLYNEKGMPVTDSSLVTLNCLLHKFFNKCSSSDERLRYFSWLIEGQIASLEVTSVREFFLRLIATENVDLMHSCSERLETDNIHDVLFNSFEKSMLFSEFELDIRAPTVVHARNDSHVEMFSELNTEIRRYLRKNLIDCLGKIRRKEELRECMNFVNVVLAYLDILLRYKFVKCAEIMVDGLHCLMKSCLTLMYMSLTNMLENNQIPNRVQLLQGIQAILIADYDSLLAKDIRRCMDDEFLQCLNNIMNKDSEVDDDEIIFEGDEEDPNALRHNCIYLLAAYCMKREEHRDEILDLVLDPKIYNFSISWDLDCAIKCIKLLEGSQVDDPPLGKKKYDSLSSKEFVCSLNIACIFSGLLFILLQNMCKRMFRNSKASYKILTILEGMLDKIWSQEKHNCHIMVKGYLGRENQYPPRVAALVYACAVKIALNLSQMESRDNYNAFVDTLLSKFTDNNHNIRLYCCYLLKPLVAYMSECDIANFVSGFSQMFVIEVRM